MRRIVPLLLYSLLALAPVHAEEVVTTTPVLADGVLYVASSESLGRRGHLRAIDISGIFPQTLWDAAEKVPLPGTGADPGNAYDSDPPERVDRSNLYRHLFCNLGDASVPFAASAAEQLQEALGASSADEARALINRVRGRTGVSSAMVDGSGDDLQRLWAISRSSPALVGTSPTIPGAATRERVLYLGAEDGLLHAFHVATWDSDGPGYRANDPDGGVELWGYLPGSFLPQLAAQPFDAPELPPAVHLDGSPALGDFFLDLDGDGRRRWHTLLVGSGTIATAGRSSLFTLDVSDPIQPLPLWEQLLPGAFVGRTRGALLQVSSNGSGRIFLTADLAGGATDPAGINACALDLASGALLWQFAEAYPAGSPEMNAVPALPALMDFDGDDRDDLLLFGDMAGRLWGLDPDSGNCFGEGPLFSAPGGVAEPLGSGVAVRGNLVVFASGGAPHADPEGSYTVYAVEILPDGARLLWSYPLLAGEQVWETPLFDAFGNLLFATGASLPEAGGRRVRLDPQGTEKGSDQTGAATAGRVVAARGVALSIDRDGVVSQLGATDESATELPPPGSLNVLSWRLR